MFKDSRQWTQLLNSEARISSTLARDEQDARNANIALEFHLREKWFRSKRFTRDRSRSRNMN